MIKKLLFSLSIIYCGSIYAQDPDLFGDWQLSEMNIDGVQYTAPSDDDVELISFDFFPSGPDNLYTSSCNVLSAEASFSGSTNMTLANVTATLGGCMYPENDDFEAIYFDFYQNANPNFTYTISDLGPNAKQLVIRDINNNVLIFNSELLRQYVFEQWFLQKMIIDDIDIPVPLDGSPFYPEMNFGQTFDPTNGGYTGDAGCSAYSGANTFVSGERVVTITSNDQDIIVCNNQAQIDFEAIYLDFLFGSSPKTFNYLYLTVDDTIIFYLRDAENNYAIFGPDQPSLGVDENNIALISIYPNPATNIVNIQADVTPDQVKLYGILGNLLITLETPGNTIDVSTLSPGVYFIEMISNNTRSIQKLIKK